MIQAELDDFKEDWNNHRIRKSNMGESIDGIPELLYFAPTYFGTLPIEAAWSMILYKYCATIDLGQCPTTAGAEDYLCGVDNEMLEIAEQMYTSTPELVPVSFQLFVEEVMQIHQIQQPTNWRESLHLFLKLKEEFQSD